MRSWLAALAAAGMLALAPTLALADTSPPVPQLSANGIGEVKVVPDIAVVTLGVTTRGSDAAGALAENSAALDKAIAAIRAAGIAEKDIATSGLSITPVYQQNRPSDAPAKIVGYTVSDRIRVTVRDVAGSAAMLDKVVQSGANQVFGIRFDIADRTAASRKAIRRAIADAMARGALMADAAGLRLVRILSLNTSDNGRRGPILAFDMAAKAAPVPVMPGEQTVSANAQIVWEVAPK